MMIRFSHRKAKSPVIGLFRIIFSPQTKELNLLQSGIRNLFAKIFIAHYIDRCLQPSNPDVRTLL